MEDSKQRTYTRESLTWTLCGEMDGEQLESTTIQVPMNHSDPTDQTFSIPLLRLRGTNATKSLLVNPGGPGTSGISLIHRRGTQLRAIVGHSFHILGFDPRGVNQSTPPAVCYPSEEIRAKHASPTPQRLNAEQLWPWVSAWAENIACASAETTGEHGKYLNTPQTAADLNSILDALGQQDMYYWGFSYGSLLGQTYAMMFPERCARVIVDGVVDVFEWYGDLLRPSQFESRADVFKGFFEECFKAKDCALSSLAPDAQQLQHKVMQFLDELESAPMSVYLDNKCHGILYKHTLYDSILHDLFFHQRWEPLANRLVALLQGDPKPAFLAYGQKSPSPSTEHGIIIRCNDMISGKDEWPQKEHLFTYISSLLEKYPNDAVDILQEYYTRAQWIIPKSHNFQPPLLTETKHPLLILSVTYDPFTPLSSAHKASKAFVGSRVVEVAGYGHTSLAVQSQSAVDHVRRFLHDGVLPDANAYCEAESAYFPAKCT